MLFEIDNPGMLFREGGVHMEQTIYRVRIHNIQRRIRRTAVSVTPDVPGRVWQEVEYLKTFAKTTI
jgi:hypothetical protein